MCLFKQSNKQADRHKLHKKYLFMYRDSKPKKTCSYFLKRKKQGWHYLPTNKNLSQHTKKIVHEMIVNQREATTPLIQNIKWNLSHNSDFLICTVTFHSHTLRISFYRKSYYIFIFISNDFLFIGCIQPSGEGDIWLS